MFWRQIENAELPYCRENDIGVVTYSGLAQGLLTGTLTAATTFAEDDMRTKTILIRPDHFRDCLTAVDTLRTIAERNRCHVAHLAIHWLTHRAGVAAALLGARTVVEAEDNAAGLLLELSAGDAALAGECTRLVWDSLPDYPDMFAAWERIELQRRRHQRKTASH